MNPMLLKEEIDTGGELVVRDCDYTLGTHFTLCTVSEQDVLRQVTALRKGSAPGLDGACRSGSEPSVSVAAGVEILPTRIVGHLDWVVNQLGELTRCSTSTNMSGAPLVQTSDRNHPALLLTMPSSLPSGSAARDPHGIKQITVGPPHGIKQITMFIRENVECLDSSFTTTTTIKVNNCTLIFHYRKL
ncbi:hypothetical protein J6590_029788 [Homalodisca vitripennis]|nr:hypothetical protein J6590_029788 [Homalodisca vitripennis]